MSSIKDLTALRNHELTFTSIEENAGQELARLLNRIITLEQELARTRELSASYQRIHAEARSIRQSSKGAEKVARPASTVTPIQLDTESEPQELAEVTLKPLERTVRNA